jgi:hypothetical protein
MNSKKAVYTPRNWPEYNKSLVNRESLTLWMSPKVLKQWYCDEKTGKGGASHRYLDKATQGFLLSQDFYNHSLNFYRLSLMFPAMFP